MTVGPGGFSGAASCGAETSPATSFDTDLPSQVGVLHSDARACGHLATRPGGPGRAGPAAWR